MRKGIREREKEYGRRRKGMIERMRERERV